MENFVSLLLTEKSFRVIGILLGILVVRIFIYQLSGRLVRAVSSERPHGKRLRTLTSIFNTFLSIAVVVIGLFMLLKELGFDITPLLTSAGILGLAVGFGAQALVKDVISGFFLILEGQFDEGDRVEINGKVGVVEKISLRTISIRGSKKELHIIPNGSINLVSNFSKED